MVVTSPIREIQQIRKDTRGRTRCRQITEAWLLAQVMAEKSALKEEHHK